MTWGPLGLGTLRPPNTRTGRFIDIEVIGGITVSGIITGTDIVSANWDGANPPTLSVVDPNASAGFALDASLGASQFTGSVFVGDADKYMEFNANPFPGSIGFHAEGSGNEPDGDALIYTALAAIGGPQYQASLILSGFGYTGVESPELILFVDDTDGPRISLMGDESGTELHIGNYLGNTGIHATHNILPDVDSDLDLGTSSLQWAEAHVDTVYADDVLVSLGAAGTPSLGFEGDSDTGFYRVAANWIATTGGGWRGWTFAHIGSDEVRLYGLSDNSFLLYNSTATQFQFYVGGAQEFVLGNTGFYVPNVYNQTPSGTANVVVDSNGNMHRSSSTLASKSHVSEARDLADIDLVPHMFLQGGEWRLGLIADYLAEQDERLAIYQPETVRDDDGVLVNVPGTAVLSDYDTRGALAVLAAKVNGMRAELDELKGLT